ncbi:MAG TPA: hypothetical protein DCK79_06530 [Candidatus Atribacteria bacterium]|nr:hypothetical protein [Candidatus Atribacteria bacterium]
MKISNATKIAIRILRKNLGVKSGEIVSIITDTEMLETAELIRKACTYLKIEPNFIVMAPSRFRGEEPPARVALMMENSEVAIIVTKFSLSHTYARLNATKKGVRMASMGSVTLDMFQYGLSADYDLIAKRTRRLSKYLEIGSVVEINSTVGTNLRLDIANRKPGAPDDGLYIKPAQWGNLPAGEAYIAPIENSVSGMLVADGTIAPIGLLSEQVIIEIDKGRITKISGGKEARKFDDFLRSVDDSNAYIVAELGIGTNNESRLIGKMIEDEKMLGTVHIGFGMNIDFGGNNKSKTHNDVLILAPTVAIDRKIIIKDGKFNIKF